MGLSRSEHDRAIALAISELAEAAGLPADDEKCPGTTALRRLAAEYRAALEWERTEHSRIEAQRQQDARLKQAEIEFQRECDERSRAAFPGQLPPWPSKSRRQPVPGRVL